MAPPKKPETNFTQPTKYGKLPDDLDLAHYGD